MVQKSQTTFTTDVSNLVSNMGKKNYQLPSTGERGISEPSAVTSIGWYTWTPDEVQIPDAKKATPARVFQAPLPLHG